MLIMRALDNCRTSFFLPQWVKLHLSQDLCMTASTIPTRLVANVHVPFIHFVGQLSLNLQIEKDLPYISVSHWAIKTKGQPMVLQDLVTWYLYITVPH